MGLAWGRVRVGWVGVEHLGTDGEPVNVRHVALMKVGWGLGLREGKMGFGQRGVRRGLGWG